MNVFTYNPSAKRGILARWISLLISCLIAYSTCKEHEESDNSRYEKMQYDIEYESSLFPHKLFKMLLHWHTFFNMCQTLKTRLNT